MKPIIVTGLDIETTGFKPEDGHRITEVGAITYKVNPETLEFTKVLTYSKLVNPGRSIPEEVQRLTNITPTTVKDAPGWDLVSVEVGKILKVTDIMIAHNAAFDAPFLAYELLRLGQPVNQDMEVFCTMQAGRFATPLGKPPRLVELCWALGVPFVAEDAHRAIYDVDRMMEAVSVGIAKGYFDFKPVLEKITQQRLAKAA